MVERLAVDRVAGADLQLLEAVEDVELGEGDAIDAGDLDRLAHERRVEPAAAAAAAGDGAELAAALADQFADLVVELAREWTGADAGGVGLGNAEDIADGLWPDAGAGRDLAGHGV